MSNNSQTKYNVKCINGKGLGMFANQNIQAGEMILSEQPLLKLTKEYTIVKEKQADIELELSRLTENEKKLFTDLSDCHSPSKPTYLTIYQTNALPLGE